MKTLLHGLVLVSSMLAAGTLHADTLSIPVGEQSGSQATSWPQRGVSFDAVVRGWGEPARRHAAVGQPPITRWDYDSFSVYFESSHVIDSVRQHKPKAP
ncbi:MAG TPA: phosphodiesterase [Pseudomonas sabulinigri]|uniref:Phosphodiesterase n=1 Tax=marine sediment metagenome TaxID=412755 RepID=A0A0F9V2P4_9ZZZZ|nr:phosphodiesterase [Halopseudomonas sabulinigri]HEC53233.1 phosphodiesterase [Halopseudomonas sabulinigri]